MVRRHCRAVAALHQEHLRSRFRGRAGLRLIEAYYAAVSEGMGACGYVAERDARVVGYVCGVWDRKALRSTLLRAHSARLLLWGIVHAVSHPSALISAFQRVRRPCSGPPPLGSGYELRPIVVAPEARGTRAARLLVSALDEDAAGRGFERIYLYTEEDNSRARRFYIRSGFEAKDSIQRAGTMYLRYERAVFGTA